MPKYYCDYCDTYLTHDSPSVRKTHCQGRKHKENVRDYYQKWMEDQAQRLIDQTTAAFKSGKMNPAFPPRFPMPPPIGLPRLPGMPPMPGMPPLGMPPPSAMMMMMRPPMMPPPPIGSIPPPPPPPPPTATTTTTNSESN